MRPRKRVITQLDPISLTQPDHKVNAIDLLRDYARGVPIPGRDNLKYGTDDINIDRPYVERLKVEAKDLAEAVKAETEKAKNELKTKNAKQKTAPTATAQSPTSPTTGADQPSTQKQPATPQGT